MSGENQSQWTRTDENGLMISIRTAEGDKVTFSSRATATEKVDSHFAGFVTSRTRLPGENQGDKELALAEEREMSVEGDLSERELEEIEALKTAVKGVLADFFKTGDNGGADAPRLDLSEWETLASVEAEFEQTSSAIWTDELTKLTFADRPGLLAFKETHEVENVEVSMTTRGRLEMTDQSTSLSSSVDTSSSRTLHGETTVFTTDQRLERAGDLDSAGGLKAYNAWVNGAGKATGRSEIEPVPMLTAGGKSEPGSAPGIGPENRKKTTLTPGKSGKPVTENVELATGAARKSGPGPASGGVGENGTNRGEKTGEVDKPATENADHATDPAPKPGAVPAPGGRTLNGTNRGIIPGEILEPATKIAEFATQAAAKSGLGPASLNGVIHVSFSDFAAEAEERGTPSSAMHIELSLMERSVFSILGMVQDAPDEAGPYREKDEESEKGVDISV